MLLLYGMSFRLRIGELWDIEYGRKILWWNKQQTLSQADDDDDDRRGCYLFYFLPIYMWIFNVSGITMESSEPSSLNRVPEYEVKISYG